MLALIFDTETTGIVKWNAPAVSPEQPNLVQLGALLVDLETRRELQVLDIIIAPDGWTIPVEASNVHGIPQALAEQCGMMLESAVLPFRDLVAAADIVIGHNLKFDKIIMERASAMVDLIFGQPVGNLWTPKNQFGCTMLTSTPIVKKPQKSKRPMHSQDFAWPKLKEAHAFFFGEEFDNQHNAMADVRATLKIFYELVDKHDGFTDQLYHKEAA
jgi:DNA polymerase-3 subunit epsilon